ncbi:hypothetical protein J4234_05110 [Candidatus Woesearchaeota archaeon]|nr:hypothetical protein [Candidatus Woesearchaeota archaeon]
MARRETPGERARREAAEAAEAERRRLSLERERLALSREQAEAAARERAESARERQEEIERRRIEEEDRQEERQRQTLGGRIQGARNTVNEKKDALINRATEITINTAKSKTFWAWFLLGLILFISAYYKNIYGFRTFVLGVGITIVGLLAIIIIVIFIGWGLVTGFTKNEISRFFIAGVLAIWLLDMAPAWLIPGWPPYRGFELPPLGLLSLSLLPVLTSSFTFALFYINMVFKIIEKEYRAFILAFGIIIISNYFIPKIFPSYLNISFSIPLGQYGMILLFLFLGWLVWKFDRNYKEGEVAGLFSSLYAMFVFSFFWLNNGWQGNIRAWLHAIYIIFFGFVYIKQKERTQPYLTYLYMPSLLIIDFFGYGFLWNSEYLFLKFIPPLTLFVIPYCYVKESNEIDGKKKATYPVMAFILLVTFFLIMTVNVAGLETNTIPYIAKQGTTFTEFYSSFTANLKGFIEGRLDIATAGLYRGNVEKNRYESLGVYFGNIRASDPRFYTDEPITVWGTIRSKTYKDAVIVSFNCSRWKDSKRIYADKIIPEIKFPIFTLEEVDTQCTFLPKDENKIPAGANIVTLSAEYNFGTDSYLKTYFMDRERFRASSREGIDPLTQFGIKDKTPAAVFTNGPVEIGLGVGPLVTVSEGYAIKPIIGITLTNRKEIQDKDKKIITRWEGKIKNITELILLTPYGITLGTSDKLEKCEDPKTELEKLECPCSMPFKKYELTDCFGSCTNNVVVPCTVACSNVGGSDENKNNCIKECQTVFDKCNQECAFLFQTNEGEGSTQEKYNAYALDVGSKQFKDLNKDIDKSRSFVCRFEPSSAVLGDSPITTRYFRVRARYNYLLENSVTVNVEQLPVQLVETVPDWITKSAIEFKPGTDIYFPGLSMDLISALTLTESRWRHCCAESGKNHWSDCKASEDTSCGPDKILTSYDDTSVGVMQVNKIHEGLSTICTKGQTIYNKECNIKVGLKLLNEKYQKSKGGISSSSLEPFCPKWKYQDRHQKYLSYRDIKATLRAYNGWGCRPEAKCQKACANSKDYNKCFNGCVEGTINYVEKILDTANKIKNGVIIDKSGIGDYLSKEDVQFIRIESESGQTDTQNIPDISPIIVRASYDYQTQVVTIRWDKPSSPKVISYDVTRFSADEPEVIVQGCQDIKEDGSGNYCFDYGGLKLIVGKPYTYTVYAYNNEGQYSGTKEYMTK